MKVPIKVEKISENYNIYENLEKVLTYRLTNDNRFLIKDLGVTAKIVKEDGSDVSGNYVKQIDGIITRLMPKDYCDINVYIKIDGDYSETVNIDGKEELAFLDIDLNVTGTLVISRQ